MLAETHTIDQPSPPPRPAVCGARSVLPGGGEKQLKYTCSSGNGVARLLGRNSGQKAQKGPQKKISGRILADFYQKQAEKGPQKICILYIKNQIYHSYHS